ncbi:MAG: DUF305 domain-containing protein, partial [Pyrinomonadaceae bacterium]
MIRRQGTDKRISKLMMVIALIFGVAGAVAVSGTQTRAQNQASSQMGNMPYDLHFIDMMIMHHREGTATARLAERKGSTAALRAFAKRTADDQE